MSHSAFSAGIEEKVNGTGQEDRVTASPMPNLRAMKMKRGLFLLATLLLVNVAVAGCKIELFDKDNYQTYAATAPSWMQNIIKEYGGNPYAHLVEMAKLAQKEGVIKGILMHQGESNTNDKQWPAKVKRVYDNLIKDLNLKAESVPLLAGELVNTDPQGACASVNALIAELPKTIPNSYVISSKGCASRPDHLHFSPAGYRELGRRYAVQMLSLLGYTTIDSFDTKRRNNL
jgi:hypothetical protein